jgi:putative endonuclease
MLAGVLAGGPLLSAPLLAAGQRALATAVRRLRELPVPIEAPAWVPVLEPRPRRPLMWGAQRGGPETEAPAIELPDSPGEPDARALQGEAPSEPAAVATDSETADPAMLTGETRPAPATTPEAAPRAIRARGVEIPWPVDSSGPLALVIADRASAANKQWLSEPVQSVAVERARSTPAQRIGDDGERLAAIRLASLGWQIVARNLRLSRAEVDLLAIDASDPPSLVVVEVRRRNRRDFGLAEETVDYRKRSALRRAVGELARHPVLPDGRRLPDLPVRVDLIAIDQGPDGRPALRHHRGIDI